MIKEGTLWTDGYGKWFRVLHLVELEGQIWVHYRTETLPGNSIEEYKEFSCFQEAFLSRFQERSE